jgi:nucleoside diphosphate kinase
MEWSGAKNNSKPVAFVGKGVTFDTGGYSLKPAKFMEDMTYDMAGSAAVVGLMKNLALRKAKINAVGVVGLVENMVSGDAQRPGDIVKSYSGKTIEVLNTDAEGRLVLADALTFTEKKFKPKFIIDLATLTGAIIVSLGSEYAGLFSNDDKLSKQILNAGEEVEEKLWRMPLHKNYDKLINSKNADMQNINYVGGAGSTTAAQFLQRFILNKTPWAHLDIAGMAFSKYGGALNSGGATGFGIRLLNQLIEEHYEYAVERNLIDDIKNIFIENNLKIVNSKKIHISKEEAAEFYKVHQARPFYNDLCTYLSSGPIFVMILEGQDAVILNRKLMGATNPKDAEPNTIRKLYGISIDKNSAHGSDSIENAKIEIDFFFKD